MRLIPIFVMWLLSLMPAVARLEVRNPRWGFGGKPTLGTFNLLSVEVRNTGGNAFDGVLTLQHEGGFSSAAPLQQQVFLAPGTTRWVQFSPYIASNYKPDYVLSWGRERDESINVDNTQVERVTGPPAVVILADPETVRTARLAVFPESMFPVTVSSTDSLHAVILDHVPRFQPPQSQAFIDWLRLGGLVHLVPSATGEYPKFEGPLAPLNIEGSKGRVGAGTVVKHPWPAGEVTPAQLATAGYRVPEEKPNTGNQNDNDRYRRHGDVTFSDSSLFQTLAGVTKPKIAWWLIYLLTGVYVIIIGPVFFVIRKRDYRLLLGGFLATVALFAWIFTVIGRRGYGESQVCHSLAVARVLGDGRFEVTHWSHAFATSGDEYRLEYPGASHLYASLGMDGERVRGHVVTGKESHFLADIPLFSFRNFLHRGVMAGDGPVIQMASLDPGKSNWEQAARFTVSGKIPGEIVRAVMQVGGSFYRLSSSGAEWKVSDSGSSDIGALYGRWSSNDGYSHGYYGRYESSEEAKARLREAAPALAQRIGAEPSRVPRFFGRPIPDRTARLYLYTSAPDTFRMSGNNFTTGENFVLYVQDFALPERP